MVIKQGKLRDLVLRQLYQEIAPDDNVLVDNFMKVKATTPAAIQISAAISAGARTLMYDYKNMENNPLLYSDVDSGLYHHPLPADCVGTKLGQMKLEVQARTAIIIRPKLYLLETNKVNYVDRNGEASYSTIVKAAGYANAFFTKDQFLQVLNGQEQLVNTMTFKPSLANLTLTQVMGTKRLANTVNSKDEKLLP